MSALMKRLSPFATTVRRETGKQVASPKGLVDRLLDTLFVWQARANERHRLGLLDDRALRDIGLSRGEIYRELDKPFWKA